jgi:hypothetical protein
VAPVEDNLPHIIVKDNDGVTLYANEYCTQLTCVDQNDLIGMTDFDCMDRKSAIMRMEGK